MQKIDSLLKHIVPQKDESDGVIQCIFRVSGIQLDKKDICFIKTKHIHKVKISLSGAQKTKLIFVKDELEKQLLSLGLLLSI